MFILIVIFGTPIVAFLLYGYGEIIDRITWISLNVRNSVSDVVIINEDNNCADFCLFFCFG